MNDRDQHDAYREHAESDAGVIPVGTESGNAERVTVTDAADDLIDRLVEIHGPLLFHQSGGCCDGSAPMCYPRGEFRIGQRDVFLGRVGRSSTPFFIGADQYAYWAHTHLTVDVVPGRGSGFSVEAPEGVRFLIRSRLFSDDEHAALTAAGPPAVGPQPDDETT